MKHPDKLALFTYLSFFYEVFHDKDPVSFHGNPKPLESPPPVQLMPSSPPSRSWNTKMTLTRPVTKEPDVKLKRVVTPRAVSPRPVSVFGGGPVDSSDTCYFCQKKVYLMERQSAQGIFFHRSCFRCYHCNSQLKTGNYSYSHGSDGEKGRFYCTPHFKQLFLSNPEAINYGRRKDGPTAKKLSPVPSSQQDQKMQSENQRKLLDDQRKPPDNQRKPPDDQRKPPDDQRKLLDDQRKQQQEHQGSEMNTTEAIQTKPAKGRGKVLDRIKNWETGNVAPMDTTPPSIHDSNRIIEPSEDSRHDDKKQEVIERRLVYSYEGNTSKQDVSKQDVSKQDVSKQDVSKQDVSKQDVSKQDVSKQDVSKQDVSKQDVSKEDVSKQDVSKQDVSKQDDVKVLHEDTTIPNRHDNNDEHSEEDDDVLPLPTTIQRGHSTPEQMRQSSEQDEEEVSHRRSSRVITRDRLKLSKKHQTTMELSSNEDVTGRGATRRRSIGAGPRRGQRSIFRKRDSDIQLTDSKLQEHRKHYSRLLRVSVSVCMCVCV